MGWETCFTDTSKSVCVQRILAEIDTRYKVISHKSVSSGLWMVIHDSETGKNFIELVLISVRKKEISTKYISASAGPFSYDCPLNYLEIASERENEVWVNWSEKVKRFHVANSKRYEIGEKVQVYGKEYVIEKVLDRKKYLIKNLLGQVYRVSHKNIDLI